MHISKEVMEAARQQARIEIANLQDRIREQRRELRHLGRAHQDLTKSYKLLALERDRWLRSWQEGSRFTSRLAEELRQAKGWDLSKYMQWTAHTKWEGKQ